MLNSDWTKVEIDQIRNFGSFDDLEINENVFARRPMHYLRDVAKVSVMPLSG
jgi:hypothetical protein